MALSPSDRIWIPAVLLTFLGPSFPDCKTRITNLISLGYCDVEDSVCHSIHSKYYITYNSQWTQKGKKAFRLCFQSQ